MASATSQRHEITRCYVCSKVYSSPRKLPCAHTFCLPCLERDGVNKRAGDVVECPLCRHEFRLPTHGFVGLPRNTFVEELAEVDKMVEQSLSETQCDSCFETATSARTLNGVCVVSPAVVHCVDCIQNFCASCCSRTCKLQSTHDDTKRPRHKVVDLSSHLRCSLRRAVRYCDHHSDEPVSIYCFDCCSTLCSCCNNDRTHRSHRCAPVEKAASAFRQQLERDVKMVTERCGQCVDEADRVEQERRQFLDDVELTVATVRETGERIQHLITEHTNKLLQQLEVMKTETTKEIDSVKSDINRFVEVANSFLRYAETLQERGTAVDVSVAGNDLLVRATMLQKMPFTESGGEVYRAPVVVFTPWYDLLELLENRDDNVVGRVTSVPQSQDVVPSSSPNAVQTMTQDSRTVLGVAAISGHVYVVRAESPEIEIYSAVTLSLKQRLPVAGLRSPTDLVACESLRCLFIADWPECRIHRVAVPSGRRRDISATVNGDNSEKNITQLSEDKENWLKDQETGWCTTERPWSLSVVERRSQCTVLVTCDQAAKLYEYTQFGSVVRQVCLSSELSNPRHAVLLDNGQFVVSLKDSVHLVGADGRRILANKASAPAGKRISCAGRLALDDCGRLLLLDVDGRRVVELDVVDSDLRLRAEVVTRDDRLRYPARLCVDRRRSRIYVADNELAQRTRLQAKFWGKMGRLIVYDIQPS